MIGVYIYMYTYMYTHVISIFTNIYIKSHTNIYDWNDMLGICFITMAKRVDL